MTQSRNSAARSRVLAIRRITGPDPAPRKFSRAAEQHAAIRYIELRQAKDIRTNPTRRLAS